MKSIISSRSTLIASLVLFFALGAVATSTLTASPQQLQPAVQISLDGEVTRSGKALSVDGLQLTPGETILWKLRLKNRSEKVVSNIHAEGLIPKGTTFVPDSYAGAGSRVEFSIDGGRSYSARPTIVVDGKVKPAPVESYTNIRFIWDGSISAGEMKTAQYKTRLR